ncbi:MAG: hypothetical protein LBV58_01135 [Acholeplasmatales bacterium]|jgi:transposase|nr:hypothetical protein [Acholeplasmatales bacterium]
MKVFKSQIVEILPTKPQEEYFWECIKYSEEIYEKAVEQWYKQLDEINIHKTRKYINTKEITKYIYDNQTNYDTQFPITILDTACSRLKEASKKFFNKETNKPRRKKKSGDRTSFTLSYSKDKTHKRFKKTPKNMNDDIKHKNEFNYYFAIGFGKYYVDKYGLKGIREFRWIKMTEEIRFPYDNHQVKTVTIFHRAGKWLANFQIEVDEEIPNNPNRINKCGIDLGAKTLTSIYDSNNNLFSINIPQKLKDHIKSLENHIKFYQQSLDQWLCVEKEIINH